MLSEMTFEELVYLIECNGTEVYGRQEESHTDIWYEFCHMMYRIRYEHTSGDAVEIQVTNANKEQE